jgi:uncharacterized protein DUF3108
VKHVLVLVSVLLAAAPSLADRALDKSVPSRVEVKYRVTIAGLPIGEGTDVFEHDGKSYSVISETSTVGIAAVYRFKLRTETKGSVTPEGLRPLSFVETRNDKFKRGASFDWTAGEVQLTDGEKKQTVPLPPNTWDTASFAWNFAFSHPLSKDLQVYVTDGRRVTGYKYAILGREKLDTPLGEMETVHVKKIQEEGDKRSFEVWLAIDQHFLPARVRATEKDGTAFDSMVESVKLGP